jgi:hemerythrin-like metal-binding protein
MSLVEWREEFRTGIDEVDFEHKELIELINNTYKEASEKGTSDALDEGLGEIFSKISAHFALEEKIMRELEYDQYQDHKEDHERLLDSIRDIMDDVSRLDEEKFGQSLKDWFVIHFSTRDARMHKQLQR